ncbi:fasciclin domain-containing protein [Chitinophagaceae bacterium LB-8]|uniref:Fasciclin domain-containing protein n=1 Tax=Paraflavisolibacter caeni TaxID=2982496 RepID=A0A9X3BK84_9BACT|nr:fasciclin domain-containing protein [Paraflavisolibacter caeni]MCU7552413.1 fasciclin domain-containing protein [Paraflavisolibacter caeni]
MKKLSIYVLLVSLLLSVASIRCSTGTSLLKAGSPLLSALSGVPNLSTFTNLLQTPGLDKLIGGAMKKPFTLLAPTNDALSNLGSSAMSNLTNPSNISQLANLIKDHIIPGKLDAASLMQTGLKAASGKALDLGSAKLGDLIGGEKFNIFPVDKLLGQ